MSKTVFGLVFLCLLSVEAGGQTVAVTSVTNNTTTIVADANAVGVTERFSMSGLVGGVTDVQVHLDLTGGFNGDLYAYLVDPQGQMSVLLNRVGVNGSNPIGYSDAGFNISLDSLATTNIHSYQGVSYTLSGGKVTGTWAADGLSINPKSSGSVFGTTTPVSGLNIYNGLNGGDLNGTWTLFVADLAAGGGNTSIDQVILSVATVPEPSNLILAAAGMAALILLQRRSCR